MHLFYNHKKLEASAPYFDDFYDQLLNIQKNFSYKYLESFFYSMLPRIQIQDSHIVKLLHLKSKIPDTEQRFVNILQDGIEILVNTKMIQEKALQQS